MRAKIIVALVILLPYLLTGTGISLRPTSLFITNVKPGSLHKITPSLKIINQSQHQNRYLIETHLTPNSDFYEPFPTKRWLTPDSLQVIVPPDSTSTPLDFSIEIPNKRENFNKFWQFEILVSNLNKGTISPGFIIPVTIETIPNRESPIPEGEISIRPSITRIKDSSTTIQIHNKTFTSCTLEISWYPGKTLPENLRRLSPPPKKLTILKPLSMFKVPTNTLILEKHSTRELIISKKDFLKSDGFLVFTNKNNIFEYVKLKRRKVK